MSIFNKRPGTEAIRIKISNVTYSAKRIKIQEECCLSLSKNEKEMIIHHFVIYSAGKRGQHDPHQFHKRNENRTQSFDGQERRSKQSINFVFAYPKLDGYIQTSEVLKKITSAETSTENCTSISLRKNQATTLQFLNLTDKKRTCFPIHGTLQNRSTEWMKELLEQQSCQSYCIWIHKETSTLSSCKNTWWAGVQSARFDLEWRPRWSGSRLC